MVAFIRIHPLNPQKGHTVKRYNYRGFTFREERGWYRVVDSLAQELEPLLINAHSGIPVKVFQVGTQDDALKIAKADYERENPQRAIEQAVTGAQTVSTKKLEKLIDPEEDLDEELIEGDEEPEEGGDDDKEEVPFG